ncbi:MAG: transposase [Gluconobacter cerinus]|uniref:transposase n=1 Tax=Gluconobacter cerinus TaxID=38307 RepID=UPI0039EB9845
MVRFCRLSVDVGQRPSGDNRQFLNGMLHVLRTACLWRDMHERYGKWNSVYVRFRRWAEQGVWDALLQTLVDLGLTDNWQHMIDSTVIRAHSQATGAKGGLFGGFGSVTWRLYEQNPCPM